MPRKPTYGHKLVTYHSPSSKPLCDGDEDWKCKNLSLLEKAARRKLTDQFGQTGKVEIAPHGHGDPYSVMPDCSDP